MKKGLWLALILAASAFAYTVQVDTAGLAVKPMVDRAFLGYDAVTLEGSYALPAEAGEPSLPAVAVSVALPPGTKIEAVETSYGEPIVLPGTYRVVPTQEPVPVGEKGGITPPDAAVYASSQPFPGKLAYAFESGNMGGYGIGNVILAPVQYVPATGKLMVYPVIDFDLKLRRDDGENVYPKVRLEWVDRGIRENLAATVINPWEIRPHAGTRLISGRDSFDADVFPYLIITNDALKAKATELADWKTKKGLRATVVTTTDISSGYSGRDTTEKVRNCIKDFFETKGTQYVCIVGYDTVVPVRKVYDSRYQTQEGNYLIPTDNYYGCLDGDFNADGDDYWGEYPSDDVDWTYDVYVGRIQVSTESELDEVVDKTLCYEGAGAASEANPYDYQNRVILAGGFLDSSTNEKALMELVRDTDLTSSHWNFTELWDITYPGGSVFNAANFISQMNAGQGIVGHAMHCNTTVIGTNSGSVYSSGLLNLTNHPKFFGEFYSLGCYPSNTDAPNNCAAYFVASPAGGGVGFTGNTRYGWYMPGSPASGASADFFKTYFDQFGPKGVYETGKLLAFHKHALQGTIGSTTMRYIYFEILHNGDPDIWIPAGNIATLNVTYAGTIPTGSQTYDVKVAEATDGNVAGALVCLWKGDEVYAAAATNESGEASFNIEPATTGTMYLTVSAHNAKTFEADVTVSASDVVLTSFTGKRTAAGIRLDWSVASAKGLSHFNLYRRPLRAATAPVGGGEAEARSLGKAGLAATKAPGEWTPVNAEPITGRSPYRYLDGAVGSGTYEYKLEAVLRGGPDELGTTQVGGGLPTAFAFGVAPNPAGTTTKVTISLPGATPTKVSVYDLAGRKVATVVDRPLAAGENSCELDVSAMPAGIYILRLEAGGSVAAKRLAVVH